MRIFFQNFGSKLNNIQEYHSPSGNVEGDIKPWQEILNHWVKRENPFEKGGNDMQEYIHIVSHKKHMKDII